MRRVRLAAFAILVVCLFGVCGCDDNHQDIVRNVVQSDMELVRIRDAMIWLKPKEAYDPIARQLMDGQLRVYPSIASAPDYSPETLDWNIVVEESPNSYQLYLQGLKPVYFLAGAYLLSDDPAYLNQAMKLVDGWEAFSKQRESDITTKYLWAGHAIALRAENLLFFTITARLAGAFDERQIDRLNVLLASQAKLLIDERYYEANHNHGTMQDRTLLVLSSYFQNEEWLRIAKERLQKQWDFEFTEEMVSKENAFRYHVMNRNLFEYVIGYLNSREDEWGAEKRALLDNADEVTGWMLKPDGWNVPFGESDADLFRANKNVRNPTLLFASSEGEKGVAPDDVSRFYRGVGYYIGREYWDPSDAPFPAASFSDAAWNMFRCGMLSDIHKQDDDNSFVFYGKGHDIFVDSGFNGYVSNELRRYVSSASAHNAIAVDGETYNARREGANVGEIVHTALHRNDGGKYDYIVGINPAYADVTLYRHYIAFSESLFIYDESVAIDDHTYTQSFHCGPDMEIVSASAENVTMKIADTGYFAVIRQLNPGATVEVLRGDEHSNVGRFFLSQDDEKFIDTIRFTVKGALSLATLITIEDADGGNVDMDAFEWDDDSGVFTFTDAGVDCAIALEKAF